MTKKKKRILISIFIVVFLVIAISIWYSHTFTLMKFKRMSTEEQLEVLEDLGLAVDPILEFRNGPIELYLDRVVCNLDYWGVKWYMHSYNNELMLELNRQICDIVRANDPFYPIVNFLYDIGIWGPSDFRL